MTGGPGRCGKRWRPAVHTEICAGSTVAFTTVSDAGLVHLGALPNLKELNARGTKVTKAGVAKLKQRLPEIKVGFGPAPK